MVTQIVARQRTGAASVACLGGVYDGAGKTGNVFVLATQSWLAMAAGVIVNAVLTALTTATNLSNVPFLSLTTASTSACTADIFIYGWDMS